MLSLTIFLAGYTPPDFTDPTVVFCHLAIILGFLSGFFKKQPGD